MKRKIGSLKQLWVVNTIFKKFGLYGGQNIISARDMPSCYLSRLLIYLTVFIVAPLVQAASGRGSFQTTKVGFLFQDYAGAANKSFALGSPGIGLELTADSGTSYLRYFFKSRFTLSEGKQNFLDAGTPFNSNYKFVQFAPELGLSFFPVARKTKGLNVYLWGVGGVSYNNLEIKSIPANSPIRSKDQSFGYGYGGGVGFELILGAGGNGNYYLIYGEAGFRADRADLANYSQFEVGGATYSIGFGF